MNQIEQLFERYTGEKPISVDELPSSGSNRRYFRLHGTARTLIGAKGTCVDENKAFWAIAEHFRAKGLNVPKVLAHTEDFIYYLQEDLGDVTLFNSISEGMSKGSYSEAERRLLFKAVSALPAIQFEGAKDFDFSICYPQPEFDERMISFDLNYFKYCFLKATGIDFSEIQLEADFKAMSDVLMKSTSDTFLYRDFQARNVMLVGAEPYFIDFQGGRKGPIYYDVASFIWQAKAKYSEEFKMELIDAYIEALKPYCPIEKEQFLKTLRHFVLFRTLQVLGAYGFRGYFEKKPHFLQSVPYAMDNIKKLLKEPFEEYPYLSKVLLTLANMREFSELNPNRKLEIKIYSFAYKKGIPNDVSGNGGGYVFDCRALENPGKFERYKKFTGLDKEVIEFMEEEGGVQRFLSKVYELADTHIQRYIERKFTHLMFSFGCTGGQHRSVYCAQHLAQYVANKFDVKVSLYHRELELEQEF